MRSRLLKRLAERIAAARTPVEAACLRAQVAICLARQGQADEATAIVKAIREEFGATPDAEVTAWVSLAESVLHFHSHPGPQDVDRLKRADALSRAMHHPVLVPLCAAWLAHLEFNANRMESMIRHAVEVLTLAQADHHAALARVSLVIADAFHFAGRYDLAKDWYAAVHRHALAEGDDAMISAMLHNVATFRANNLRLCEIFGLGSPGDVMRAMLEADSTRNYDAGIGTTSMSLYVPVLRAQLLTIDGKYEEALALFASTLPNAQSQGMSRLLASLLADSAWCKLNLGMLDEAAQDVAACISAARDDCDPDDLATAYGRIARVLDALGRADESAKFWAMASQQLSVHAAAQSQLLDRLSLSFPDGKWATTEAPSSAHPSSVGSTRTSGE